MAYQCCHCERLLPTPQGLIDHMRVTHPERAVVNNYNCMQGICNGRVYNCLQQFKRHLVRDHPDDALFEPEVELMVQDDNALVEDENVIVGDGDGVPPEQEQEEATVAQLITCVSKSSLLYVSKLHAHDALPRSAVQEIVSFNREFSSSGYIDILKRRVENLLNQLIVNVDGADEVNAEVEEISRMFEILQSPFSGLETEAQRFSVLSDCKTFIEPLQFVMGIRILPVHTNGHPHLQPILARLQFIPMRYVLQAFLSLEGVFDSILENYQQLMAQNHTISNFVQGSLWKKLSAPFNRDGKIVLPLFLSFDEYEPNNSLGSHAVDQKIAALYFSIACLPQHWQSCLKNLFVAALCYGVDRSEFGNSSTFWPVIEELIFLERTGITLDFAVGPVQVYFVLGLLLGDNLGQNQVMGFTECFTANYFCRVCKLHRNVMRHQFEEDVNFLRNRQNYAEDVALENMQLTGIKEMCTWNEVPSFHVTENKTGDLLHDFEEGVCGYGIVLILYWLICVYEFLTFDVLHHRIQTFDYGPNDIGNKPPTSKITQSAVMNRSKLLLSGSESLCLTRHLSLMIGDLIPEDNDVWQYYLSLRLLSDSITSPHFQAGTENYVSVLVRDHNFLFVNTFNEPLKPVHHFLTHYERYMRENGPMLHTSSKRSESKHREGTVAAHVTNSRIQLPVTLAIKTQLKLSYRLLSRCGLSDNFFTQSGANTLVTRQLLDYLLFAAVLNVPADEKVASHHQIEFKGTIYRVGSVLVIDENNLYPIFSLLRHIIVNQAGELIFICQAFDTVGFCEHLHTFRVEPSDNWHCTHPNDLRSYMPLVLRTIQNGQRCVSLRFEV